MNSQVINELKSLPWSPGKYKEANTVLHSLETASCWVWWDMGSESSCVVCCYSSTSVLRLVTPSWYSVAVLKNCLFTEETKGEHGEK